MLSNVFSYFKEKSFLVVTALYIIVIIQMKVGILSAYINIYDDLSIETYLFSEYTSLLMINSVNIKIKAINTLIFYYIPTLIYLNYILIKYYHFSFGMDNTFVFLRISRKKKLIYYILESFIMLTIVFTFLTLYKLLLIHIKYDLVYSFDILVVNYINTLFFYFLLNIILLNLVILLGDWKGNVVSLLIMVFISAGNYLINYKYIYGQNIFIKINGPFEEIIEQALNNINQKIFKSYIPTLTNALYFNNIVYSLCYLVLTIILIFLVLYLFKKIDLNKEVKE